jgi:Tc5 transposase DNA-binding domain.
MTPMKYFRDVCKLSPAKAELLTNMYYKKWKEPKNCRIFMEDLLGKSKKSCGKRKVKKTSDNPYHDIEIELYHQLMESRKASRKCSAKWISNTALKILEKFKDENPERWNESTFKASYSWMRRFMTRRRTKFRKRKCGKEHTAEE